MCKPDDERYREIIIQNLDDSILVEAGAGSGKTTSLVHRMLALIGSGRCTVDKMAAVTFTRKAAAELKGKFRIALEDTYKKEGEDERRRRYEDALTRLELFFSGTIHSFCTRLLRERPIEARLDPGFEELEENEAFLLRDRCWREYLEGLHMEGAPILDQMAGIGLEPSRLIVAYQKVSLYPEVEVVRQPLERPNFSKEKELLKKYLESAWKAMPRKAPEKGWDDLQGILRQARLRCAYLGLEEDMHFIKVLTGLDRSGEITQNRWQDKEMAKAQKETFERFKADVISPCLRHWRQYCHNFIMTLVVPAVNYFKEVREKRSLMDFQDLLLKTAELLRDNPDVREYFQERFTHILVDEFQDTDPVQAEVILYLTGVDLNEMSWQRLRVRPGSLFIVGDPKQSIYRFRRADIDIYNEMKRIIRASGGHVIPLTTNFRSLPEVCDWINPIFENRFPAEATRYQPAFEPLNPYKRTKGGGVRTITIHKVNRNNQEEIARQDAARIASWIHWALNGNFKIVGKVNGPEQEGPEAPIPGDFMILAHYKVHLPVYARALEEHGIPYEISGGGAFRESDDLKHLINLLLAVAEQEDKVALIAALRGPFFGVSDDMLYRFKKGGGIFSYLAPADLCKDKEAGQRIEGIFEKIRQFHQWTTTKPPVAALSLILNHLGIIPLALTRQMGESRAGNILKAIEICFYESFKTRTSFPDMVERLREYYKEVDVEEMSIEPGKKDAVRLMNLHKAKGLEAPVVFLADPLKDTDHTPIIHVTRAGNSSVGYFLAYQQTSEFRKEVIGIPPDWEKYEALEKEYQKAEEDRLLYVATTRAKQLLVISRYPEKPDKGAWKDLYPYLDGVEELEMQQVPMAGVKEGIVTPQSFISGKEQMARRIAACRNHTYEDESVTGKVKSYKGKTPFAEDTEMGMSWGRVIHKMLEASLREEGIDLVLIAENILREEERPISEKDSVIATVKAVMASNLWYRMKKADSALAEVPFSLRIEEEGMPKIISGVIDLAFREPDGWVIADYKTDKIDGNLDALIAHYKSQVEMYRNFWEKMSGEGVKETGLFFVDVGKWVILS